MNVDTKNINLEVNDLDRNIEEYTSNNYALFYELSKLDSYWKGSSSNIFFERISKEKLNTLLVIENLQKVSNIYKEISSTYDKDK